MPELPEVETIRAGLSKLLPGLIIKRISYDNPKSFPNVPSDVNSFAYGAKILKVSRRAKVLLIELDSGYTLITHLKMTGQLVFLNGPLRFGAGHPTASLVASLPDKSTRVTITFEGGEQLFFNDQRKFGWMRLIPTIQITELDFFKKFGPEPLSPDFTWTAMRGRLQKKRLSVIKAALLDQSVLAGVGNIYTDESLWGAKIHPAQKVGDLSDNQFKKLFNELQFVLKLAIEKGGSTDRNYVDAEGKKGSYLTFARVFRREGQNCPRCGHIILKTRVAGRGTHYCPHCQKLKK